MVQDLYTQICIVDPKFLIKEPNNQTVILSCWQQKAEMPALLQRPYVEVEPMEPYDQ